jgi:hypothetical protein
MNTRRDYLDPGLPIKGEIAISRLAITAVGYLVTSETRLPKPDLSPETETEKVTPTPAPGEPRDDGLFFKSRFFKVNNSQFPHKSVNLRCDGSANEPSPFRNNRRRTKKGSI